MGGSLAQVNLPNAISTTAYDAANELTQWGTATPTYDANGNMLSDGTNAYVWDARNHLQSMDSGADTFQYGPFGRRVAKATILGTTNYLYDGENPAQELSGTSVTANRLTGLGVDEYFQRTDPSGTANFLTDALGSTVELTDGSGNSLAQYTYEPFGNTTGTGTSSNPYQYTGHVNDDDGLYFYRNRYYSPTLQRFVSEDPIEFAGGFNVYAYVTDDPIRFNDPLGLDKREPQPPPIWMLQADVFFSALGRNFANEFEPNGCFAQFANGVGSDLSQGFLPSGSTPESVIQSGTQISAFNYAVGRGLSTPLRSQGYRDIFEGGELLSSAATIYALGDFDNTLLNSYENEMQSLGAGTCQ